MVVLPTPCITLKGSGVASLLGTMGRRVQNLKFRVLGLGVYAYTHIYIYTHTYIYTYVYIYIYMYTCYPSIHNEHLIEVLLRAVYRQYLHTGTTDFVLQLLNVILRNKSIQRRGELFQAFGIATGLPPGAFLANICLNEVDILVMQSHADIVAFYATIVDDSVVCAADIDAGRSTQNSWRPEIMWEVGSHGGRTSFYEHPVAFLDIALSPDAGKLTWQTWRKPLNKYQHIHCDSFHPMHSLRGPVRGETVRLWRTNKHTRGLHHHRCLRKSDCTDLLSLTAHLIGDA